MPDDYVDLSFENSYFSRPKWMIKKYEKILPNGVKIRFGGANPEHFQINFFTTYPIHMSFTIRQEDVELHLTYDSKQEKKKHAKIFNIENEDIRKEVKKLQKQNKLIERCFPTHWWKKYGTIYRVLDTETPDFTFHQSIPLSIDPVFLKENRSTRKHITQIEFKFGFVFDVSGQQKGLLCGHEESGTIIFIKQAFLIKIINNFLNLDTLSEEIKKRREQFKEDLIKNGQWGAPTA